MRKILTKQNIEWAADLWLRVGGNRLARNAGYLIIAGVAALSNAVQLVIGGLFALFGRGIQIADTPWWVVVCCIGAAVILLVVDRYLPETARPTPHDLELFRHFRVLFDDNVMYFLRTHDFGGGLIGAFSIS